MTILKRSITLALGAGIALTPVLAFAENQDGSTTPPSMPHMRQPLLNRPDGIPELQDRVEMHGDASTTIRMGMDASTTRPMLIHAGDQGMRGGNGVSSSTHARIEARADIHIDSRVSALQKLSDRISNAPRLPDGVKTGLTATLATQMQKLSELKAKIGGDMSTTSMRDDAGKIRPEFRTYALVLPQTAITAGSNRVLAIATQMDAIGAKLNTRINDAAASSTPNIASAQSAYTDYVAKIADAKVQANAAAALVVSLTPDNGDKTVFTANSTALKAAAADLKTAQADLKAARAEIGAILKVIKGTGVRTEATSTAEVR